MRASVWKDKYVVFLRRRAAMVPDICLWVLRCAMEKFRPCSVIRCGHIHSMLPCFFLAKPEFFSLPLAKTSSTMPGIFLGTFHDRCRRFGSHSSKGAFFVVPERLRILLPQSEGMTDDCAPPSTGSVHKRRHWHRHRC